jgi:prevent-host-death family protein
MKRVRHRDVRNALSALVRELEESGADILITRYGEPVARLTPVEPQPSNPQAAAAIRLLALQAEARRRRPDAEAVPWETLKRAMSYEGDEAPVIKIGDRITSEPAEPGPRRIPWELIDALCDEPFMPEGREDTPLPDEPSPFD